MPEASDNPFQIPIVKTVLNNENETVQDVECWPMKDKGVGFQVRVQQALWD
jgi:hypothetical protein